MLLAVYVHFVFCMKHLSYSQEVIESRLYAHFFLISSVLPFFVSSVTQWLLIHKNSLKERCIAIDSFPNPLSLSRHNTNYIFLFRKGTLLIAVMECHATVSQNWIRMTKVSSIEHCTVSYRNCCHAMR